MIKILDPRFNHMMKVSQISSKVQSQDNYTSEMSINNLFCHANVYFESRCVFKPTQTSAIELFCENS